MSKGTIFQFRLYVAGDAPNSNQAIANLRLFCKKHLKGRHKIEEVDVMHEPARALAEGVFLTPMLVRIKPCPLRRIVGNLSDPKPLLQLLE
jgi:circadian clock protein KaiB